MTKREEDKLSMYLAVLSVCERHRAAWQDRPAFVAARDEFAAAVGQMQSAASIQGAGVTGVRRDKEARRAEMAQRAVPVGNAVEAYAGTIGDAALAARVTVYPSTFTAARDTEAAQIAGRIRQEAQARLGALGAYGITADTLAGLEEATDAYAALIAAPRQAHNDRKAATRTLRESLSRANRLLSERMDKLIRLVGAESPGFETDYRHARRVIRSGTRRRPNPEAANAAETGGDAEGSGGSEAAGAAGSGGDGTPIE